MKQFRLLVFGLFALCSMISMAQEVEADNTGYIVKVGQMAPDFAVTLTDGKTVKLSELRGKVVMLQFTASWCGVCRKEMPFIEQVLHTHWDWIREPISLPNMRCVRQV